MLARLQQALTLGAVTLVMLMLAAGAATGRTPWAIAASLLVLCGHALVLGIEFILMGRVNRGDTAPAASAAQRLRAWLGESISAPVVFCWRQPFRSQLWPDHLPAGARGRRGLVLVHGFVCNRGLWNRWYPHLRQRGVPYVAVNLEPVFGSIERYASIVEEAVARVEAATGKAPVLVAHSMGGLAVRRWLSHASDERFHHVVTIGTPHRGTWLARWAMSSNAREMRLVSEWRDAVEKREAPHRAAQFTCFWSHCDNIVFPASTATLPGALNVHLEGVAHVHMVDRPEPLAEVLCRLDLPAL